MEYIDLLIELANKSLEFGDVPIGAIIVKDRNIIGKGYNTREKDNNILGHAEVNAIKEASKYLNRWNLSDCKLYVSLKPCSMCLEVIKQSRISNVYYLVEKLEYKKEFNKTKVVKLDNENKEKEYLNNLQNFFKKLR